MTVMRLFTATVALGLLACQSGPVTSADHDLALQVQTQVFDLECANCHYDTFVDPVLTDKGSVETHLIWRYATQNPQMYRVNPGDPDNSWLMVRLRGEQGTDSMPPGDPMEEERIALVEQWIREGARISDVSDPLPRPTFNLPPVIPEVLIYRDYGTEAEYDFQTQERRPYTIHDGDILTFFFYMVDHEDSPEAINTDGYTYAYFRTENVSPAPDRFFGRPQYVENGPMVGQWEGQRYNYRLDWTFDSSDFYTLDVNDEQVQTPLSLPATLRLTIAIRDTLDRTSSQRFNTLLLVEQNQ